MRYREPLSVASDAQDAFDFVKDAYTEHKEPSAEETEMQSNALVKVIEQNSTQAVNARVLHENLGVQWAFRRWIKNRISTNGLVEGKDYTTVTGVSTGGRPGTEYFLAVGVAKYIAATEDNEKGREIRDYLIKTEAEWNSPKGAIRKAMDELLEMGRNAVNSYAGQICDASWSADKVDDLQHKYKLLDKVAKPDVDVLFRCAVALKRYYYDSVVINDALVISCAVQREKINAMLKMLEENRRLELEGKGLPEIESDAWLDRLYEFFRVEEYAEQREERRAARQRRLLGKQKALQDRRNELSKEQPKPLDSASVSQ